MTIPQAFEVALQHHHAGRLADAEMHCRQILAVQPNHADALHLLGVIAHQAGRHDLAAEWIRKAIVAAPNNPAAHCDLGEAWRLIGRLDEAVAAYRGALALKSDYPEALSNLGVALARKGQLDEAVAAYRRALELKPDYAEAHYNLGNALRDRGQLDEAVAAFRRALELKPDFANAHNNLGNALKDRGELDEATATFRRALQLQPDYALAWYNLGNVLTGRGQLDEAIAAFFHVLRLKPDHPEACNNLGGALVEQGRLDEAAIAYRRALRLRPDHAEAYSNLGKALAGRGQLDEAIAAYRRALELKPGLPDAWIDLGNALKDQGQLDDALAAYRRALELKPEDAVAHSNVVYALHFLPGHDEKTIAAEQRQWNRQFSEPVERFVRPHAHDRNPKRQLRIGYVSPDFRDHVIGRNLVPLFQHHDRLDFEILCYSGVLRPDYLTADFRQHAVQWRSTVGIADEALAEMVRQDGVDILVDLTQHMADSRLPVFARQPAPVQVSFAGYPASTGLAAIGYRISDRYLEGGVNGISDVTPQRSLQSNLKHQTSNITPEQVCLIESFWCYDPCGVDVVVSESPAQQGGRVTFGSLNNFCKINEPVLRLWARVLGTVTDSRLVLLSPAGSHRQRTLEILGREGVEAQRVEFVEPRGRQAYLELYRQLDIVLDPFPYHGHTTSLDALWMGVPVVSLAGAQAVSRAGLSQLSNLGLQELVALSEDDYLGIATRLAHDLPRLAELRATLRPRMEASPLMDGSLFARNVEAAFRTIWQQWCAAKLAAPAPNG